MTTRYSRQQQSGQQDGEFTPWTLQQIQKSQVNARMHQVEMASITEGRVTEGQRQLALQHHVNLHHGTCTCHIYQDLGLPCQHALACILYIQRNPQQYIPDDLSVNTWRQTYVTNVRPVIFTPLPQDPEIQAPLTRVPRGRPRKERYRRDARGQRGPRERDQVIGGGQVERQGNQQRCSTCQATGHNARTCRNPHM